ncbi:AmmeMemoRadiSam system protein A [Stackebrandtia nassauensis]|uniref:AMMECR1 domain protein n=1 Tax=Stackebrandtia nassauensis (strain DSM 44728 / CIP 108903 / NRRL B-16338 / NBRC 102104 / LLR-40K-21) TaxID=446470 RepID=D3Q726_STANL|nr:AmmeMemoRadiSam system protein A [Stackebrandtia nassauensis]ADD40425.1 AMMECR1 domain protein [Stackebrandtia nassauensis DSM 44728]
MTEDSAFAAAVPTVAAEAVRHALLGENLDTDALLARLTGTDEPLAEALRREGASFVTLQRDGKLRGCIGTLIAHRRLLDDVAHNARKAMNDPRMPAVDRREWPQLSISVSVLSPPTPLPITDRADLEAALRPGVDGLTLREGGRRATFLPSVWESLPKPADFVAALLRKGGWDSDWPQAMTAETYGTDYYTSAPPRPPLEET